MGKPGIEDIAYYLPDTVVTNEDIARSFPDQNFKRTEAVTGIRSRHIEDSSVPLSDMAVRAAENLFASGKVQRDAVDFIVLVTQTGDYRIPATSCIIQDKLGFSKTTGALDINLGCSGYVYGLAVAQSLVYNDIAGRVLLLAAEKPLLYVHPEDSAIRFLHGDAATATIISNENITAEIGEFDLGTDGSGAKFLMVPAGGTAMPYSDETHRPIIDGEGHKKYLEYAQMDGLAIYNFSVQMAPASINRALEKNKLAIDDVSYFILHQANKVIVDSIRAEMNIDINKVPMNIDKVGNTASASIPLILSDRLKDKDLKPDSKILLSGFGIGLSWASVVLTTR